MKKLNKKEVMKNFNEIWRESVASGAVNRGDSILKREQFNNYVDGLEKDGYVNVARSRDWVNPY